MTDTPTPSEQLRALADEMRAVLSPVGNGMARRSWEDDARAIATAVVDLEGERDQAHNESVMLSGKLQSEMDLHQATARERTALRAAVERVRALHHEYPHPALSGDPTCAADGDLWPCPTIRALGEGGDA